jgi:5-methylcytosine-specific restriction endonuclease McrA
MPKSLTEHQQHTAQIQAKIRAWTLLKGRLLNERGYVCEYCGRKINDTDKATLDHKNPKTNGGNDDENNLAVACMTCNKLKGDMKWGRWKKLLRHLLEAPKGGKK